MDDRLPDRVDVIVVGTGLPEAVLAAACSRSGLSVLHLDENAFYGENWASFNLNTLNEWIDEVNKGSKANSTTVEEEELKKYIDSDERIVSFGSNSQILNLTKEWTEDSSVEKTKVDKNGEPVKTTGREIIESEWRRFSIDITPKVLLSRGAMVQTLCDSEVSKYAEFKCVNRLLCFGEDGKICRVPYSRSEIFETDQLSFVDKRRVMKFMQFCLEWNKNQEDTAALQDFLDKPFAEFLSKVHGLEGSTQRFMSDAIAILEPNPTTLMGLKAVCRFIDSAGVFGPSPFLYPLYGCGELPQCFCRLCAVFGGLYALNIKLQGIVLKENKIVAIIVDDQRINCDHLIVSPRYAPKDFGQQSDKKLDRSILITDGSILEEDKEQISILSLASICPSGCARIFEAGYDSCLAPRGYYISQITAAHSEDQDHLKRIENRIYTKSAEGPSVLMRVQFSMVTGSFEKETTTPSNFAVLPSPNVDLDFADVISSSRDLFTAFWPDRDFLPRSLHIGESE